MLSFIVQLLFGLDDLINAALALGVVRVPRLVGLLGFDLKVLFVVYRLLLTRLRFRVCLDLDGCILSKLWG